MHVLPVERGLRGNRNRLLAGAFHVEAGLPLPLGAVHAVVEDADRDHIAQHLAQRVGIELRVPGTDGLVVLTEDADERRRQRVSLGGGDIGVRARRAAGGGHLER